MPTNVYQKRLSERRKSSGLCVRCGMQLDRTGSYCNACNDRENERKRLDKAFYIKHGICPSCRKNILLGNERRCPECKAKETEQTMRKRDRDHYNSVHRVWAKTEYQRRKESGLCTRCGKRKPDHGYFTCGICRAKDNRSRAKRIQYKMPDRKDRYKEGLCFFCDSPIKKGYKVCEKHYQMNIENSRKRV